VSRHVPRRERWSRSGASAYRCPGALVRPWKGAWYAWLAYHLADPGVPPGQPPVWLAHTERLGPFRRPRNAMMAAKEQLTLLSRRQGDRLALEPEVAEPEVAAPEGHLPPAQPPTQ
jgi:hypothetical protein